ncbi:MAG: hypothetical protein Q9162_004148 [Coniocarpon cinnabarinum]
MQNDKDNRIYQSHEQLEVCFAQDDNVNGTSLSSDQQRPNALRRNTSCLVHGLFQDDRLKGDEPPTPHKTHTTKLGDKDPHGHAEGAGPNVSSRLLTKKQLSDMAFSIRELSKRLGNYRLKMKIQNVFLLTKAYDQSLIALTREVAEWLLNEQQSKSAYNVYVEDTLKDNKVFDGHALANQEPSYKERLRYWDNDLCRERPHMFDIIVALGGDGTVLYASWLFQNVVPPVLSFALGSLGFLTKFDFGRFRETLSEVFHEGLTVSLRLRLEATVMRAQNEGGEGDQHGDLVQDLVGEGAEDHQTHVPENTRIILNDLVLDRGPNPSE